MQPLLVHPSASPITQTQELFLTPVSVAPDLWRRLGVCVWQRLRSGFPPGRPYPRCAWVQNVSASV